MHPRVDRVLHGEVSGFADEKAPPARHTAVGHRGVPPLPEGVVWVDTKVGSDEDARQEMMIARSRSNTASWGWSAHVCCAIRGRVACSRLRTLREEVGEHHHADRLADERLRTD